MSNKSYIVVKPDLGVKDNWSEVQSAVAQASRAAKKAHKKYTPYYMSFTSRADAEAYYAYAKSKFLSLDKDGNDYDDSEIEELAERFPLTIFTDGGTTYGGGRSAAWAYSIQKTAILSTNATGGAKNGHSHDEMEVNALNEALTELIKEGKNTQAVLFGIDSSYVLNGIVSLKKWEKDNFKGKSYPKLWKAIDEKIEQIPDFKVVKINSHENADNFFTKGNALVDQEVGKYRR